MHLTCPIGLGPDGLMGFLTGLSRRDKIEKDNNNHSKNASIVQIPVVGEWKTSGLPRSDYSSPCELETHLEFPFLHASGNQTGSLCHGGPLRPPVQHCRKAQVWLCTHIHDPAKKIPRSSFPMVSGGSRPGYGRGCGLGKSSLSLLSSCFFNLQFRLINLHAVRQLIKDRHYALLREFEGHDTLVGFGFLKPDGARGRWRSGLPPVSLRKIVASHSGRSKPQVDIVRSTLWSAYILYFQLNK